MFVFFVICAAVAEAAHVLLIYDSSKPHIAFAAGDIRKALDHHGHTFIAPPFAEVENTTSDIRIVLATMEDHQALDRHARDGGVNPSGLEPQGFALSTTENPAKAFWVLGADSSGVMYGGLELAKKLHVYDVSGSWNFQQNAFIKKRGIKFNIALDKNNRTYIQKDGPTWNVMINAVWDINFWREYFDEMARARYNLISFWSHHPFTAMMKVPGYENAVQEDVYDYHGLVKKMTIEEKTAFWKRVHQMANDRGIQVYWMTWNIHLSGAGGKYGLQEKEISSANIAYFRKSMTQFLVEFPLVKGFIVHAGENFNEDNRALRAEFMWNAYGLGIQDYQQQYDPNKKRDFIFVYRLAEGSTETIEKYFAQLVYNYDFSLKYPWAHMFAHSAPTLYKNYKGENVVDQLKKSGRRMWLNLRNDDIYFQSWGNYEFARSYILNFPHEEGDLDRERYIAGYYMGSDGNTMTRLWYAKEESLNGMLEFHKHWYMHYAFGYAGYDPYRTEEDFLDIMRMKHPGISVEALNDYWSCASRGICMANTMVTHSHSWRADWQWWPEGCFRKGGWGSIAEFAGQSPQNGSEDPVILPAGSDWSPRGLCGFDEYKNETCGTRETPVEWGNRIMSYALQGLQVSSMSSEGDELLGLIIDDIKSLGWLGYFYSGHIRATAHHLKGEKAEAIAAAAQAYNGWKRYAELMDSKYKERVHNRVNFSGDFSSKLEYALRDYHYVGGEGIPEDKADTENTGVRIGFETPKISGSNK